MVQHEEVRSDRELYDGGADMQGTWGHIEAVVKCAVGVTKRCKVWIEFIRNQL